MSTEKHVHDCTGPDMRCPCGFVFTVPRFMVSLEVYDNSAKRELVGEHFSTDGIGAAIEALRDAADTLEHGR